MRTNNRPALRDLIPRSLLDDTLYIILPRRPEVSRIRPQRSRNFARDPMCDTARSRLRIDVRPRAQNDPDPSGSGGLVQRLHSAVPVEVDNAWGRVDRSPVQVYADRVQTGGFDLLQNIGPKRGHWQAVCVEFARTVTRREDLPEEGKRWSY